VLWDGGFNYWRIELFSCGHCVTVCPCQRPDGKIHARACGIPHALPRRRWRMIDVVKGVEPETGYGAILKLSEASSHMRSCASARTKTVCTYCGVGCSFDVWTKDRHILKVEPLDGRRTVSLPALRKVRMGLCEQSGPADETPYPPKAASSAKPRGTRLSIWWLASFEISSKERTGFTGVCLFF